MPTFSARSAGRLTGLLLALMILTPASASADWPTYRGDPARSGIDTSSVGSVPFAAAWSSANLGGDIYGEPLVHDGLVIVATESDQVVALSESTGQVVWTVSAGKPVPSLVTNQPLPCGDIKPTVGITSTPVIDPVTNRVFVLADNWDGSNVLHRLYAFNIADGSAVAGFPVSAEPPGDEPAAQLQRTGLALAKGQIIIGYGGNAGDCPTYHGWLVSIPETGGSMQAFEVDRSGSQGAIWESGNAPPVDSAGDVWISTGNGNSSSNDYQESVLKLDPSKVDPPLDQWAPSDWASLDSSDADIGSSAPVLLPNGLVFEIGKQGFGYLLSASGLGGVGAAPRLKASVCSGSWGGGIYYSGVIYVTCSNGLHALSLDASAGSFSALNGWQVAASANGPPIVAGNLVWATDWNHGVLYGLNPQTGQPVVTQSTPAMDHFATPSASDGKLFLATGPTVEAYTIANPAPSTPVTGSGSGSTATPAPGTSPAKCVLKLRSSRVTVHHPKRRRHQKHAPPAFATVAMTAKCDQAVRVKLTGMITERLSPTGKHGKARLRRVRLTAVQATLAPGAIRTLQIRLSPSLLRALERRVRESGAFTLTTNAAGGIPRVVVRTRLRM